MKKYILSILIVLLMAVSAHGREVTLQWDSNSEQDINSYVVYWGTETGNYTTTSIDMGDDIGLNTSYVVELPDDEQVYYFAVKAVDDSGLESDYSNEVNTEGYEEPEEYLYLPPAAPTQNTILSVFRDFPDGTRIEIVEPGRAIVTYPNGMIIEIVGTVATVTQQPTM